MQISTDILMNEDGTLNLRSDTDVVPYMPAPYRVKTLLPTVPKIFDYNTVTEGQLVIKHERSLNKLNFDLNEKGELVIIGIDASAYYISDGTDGNSPGDLMYNYEAVSDGIGSMAIEENFIIA